VAYKDADRLPLRASQVVRPPGWDLPEMVIETGESPRTIRALYEEYTNRFRSRRDTRRGRGSSARG